MRCRAATLILTAIIVIMFVRQMRLAAECCGRTLPEIIGATSAIHILLDSGAAHSGMDLGKDWWRIVASMFLHAGLLHVAVNLFTLLETGYALETLFGSPAVALSFSVGGAVAALATLAIPADQIVYVGASGGIYAMAGTLLISLRRIWLAERARWSHRFSSRLFGCVTVNLGLGLMVSAVAAWSGMGFVIANVAHIAGFVTGMAIGALPFRLRNNAETLRLMRHFDPPPEKGPRPPAQPYDV